MSTAPCHQTGNLLRVGIGTGLAGSHGSKYVGLLLVHLLEGHGTQSEKLFASLWKLVNLWPRVWKPCVSNESFSGEAMNSALNCTQSCLKQTLAGELHMTTAGELHTTTAVELHMTTAVELLFLIVPSHKMVCMRKFTRCIGCQLVRKHLQTYTPCFGR